MRDLRGRRALITGGGGGIGAALGAALVAQGVEVLVGDVDEGAAAAVAARLRAAGGAATALHLDVADAASVAAAHTAVTNEGALDLLINNAGIVRGGAFMDVPLAEHRRTVAVNLDGMMAVTHAFLPHLVQRPAAHIVNIVSASAFVGLPFGASYAASKWGALGFSESLRLELRTRGQRHVGVTAICPAYVDTGMFTGAKAPPFTRFLTPDRLAAATIRGIRANTPIVRLPWTVHLSRLAALLPASAFDAVVRLFGIDTSMRDWTGHDHAADSSTPDSRR